MRDGNHGLGTKSREWDNKDESQISNDSSDKDKEHYWHKSQGACILALLSHSPPLDLCQDNLVVGVGVGV